MMVDLDADLVPMQVEGSIHKRQMKLPNAYA